MWSFPNVYLYFLTHENVYFIRHVFVYPFVYCNMSPIKLKYVMIFWSSLAWSIGGKWCILSLWSFERVPKWLYTLLPFSHFFCVWVTCCLEPAVGTPCSLGLPKGRRCVLFFASHRVHCGVRCLAGGMGTNTLNSSVENKSAFYIGKAWKASFSNSKLKYLKNVHVLNSFLTVLY